MKRNHVTLAILLAALSFLAAPTASALSTVEVQAIQKAVGNVPAAELAAKAAQIIAQTSKADRQDVALAMVREIAAKRPATVVSLVAAISKAAPEVSAKVAAEAAKLSKDQAVEIAKAAVTIAPDQAATIKEEVVASVPSATAAINADSTITRLSQRSAATPGSSGFITTRPGTIRGTPAGTDPTPVNPPTPGSDPNRPSSYGTP